MAQKALGSFQGSFGQYNEIVKHIEKHKKGLPSLSDTKTLGQWQSMLWTTNGCPSYHGGAPAVDQGDSDLSRVDRSNLGISVGCTENQDSSNPFAVDCLSYPLGSV